MQDEEAFELQVCMLGQWSSSLLEVILCSAVFSFSVLKNCHGTFLHTPCSWIQDRGRAISFSKVQIKKNYCDLQEVFPQPQCQSWPVTIIHRLFHRSVFLTFPHRLHYKRSISLLMAAIRKSQLDGAHWVRRVPAFVGLTQYCWMILSCFEEKPVGADLNVCRKQNKT